MKNVLVLLILTISPIFSFAQTIFDEPEIVALDQAVAIDMRSGKINMPASQLEDYARQSLAIAEDSETRPRVRAAAYLIYSRILGYQARTEMSPSKGRAAYQALELANEILPNDFNVVRSFGEMILGFRKQNFAKRLLLEASLRIDLKDQVHVAIQRLLALQSQDPTILQVLAGLTEYT